MCQALCYIHTEDLRINKTQGDSSDWLSNLINVITHSLVYFTIIEDWLVKEGFWNGKSCGRHLSREMGGPSGLGMSCSIHKYPEEGAGCEYGQGKHILDQNSLIIKVVSKKNKDAKH